MSLQKLFQSHEIFRIDREFSDYSLNFAQKIIAGAILSMKEKDLTEKIKNNFFKNKEESQIPNSFQSNYIKENEDFSTYHRPIEKNNQKDEIYIKIIKNTTKMAVKNMSQNEEKINVEENFSLNLKSFQKDLIVPHPKTTLKQKLLESYIREKENTSEEKILVVRLKIFPLYIEEKISSEIIVELNTKNYEKRLISFPRRNHRRKIRPAKTSIDYFAFENDYLSKLFEYKEEIEFSTINSIVITKNNSNFFSSCEESKINDFFNSNNLEPQLFKDLKNSDNKNETKLLQSNFFYDDESNIKCSSETIFFHQNKRYNNKIQNYDEYEKQQSSMIENLKSEGCDSSNYLSEYENGLNLKKVISEQVDDLTSFDLRNLLIYQKNKSQLENIETMQSLELVRNEKSFSKFSKIEDKIKNEQKINPNNLKKIDSLKENISNRINEQNTEERREFISRLAKRSLSCKPNPLEKKTSIKEQFLDKPYSFIGESKVILEGWLHKKSGNFIVGWQVN